MNEELPENYWVLQRYVKNEHMFLIGEAMAPYYVEKHLVNEKIMAGWLNEKNCFDRNIRLKENDGLEIVLRRNEKCAKYLYKFRTGQWVSVELKAPSEFGNNYVEIDAGCDETNLNLFL